MPQVHYSKYTELAWHRVKKGDKFIFVTKSGKEIPKSSVFRISKLVIPPAWKKVSVSRDPDNYIQAIGVDAAGRRQYIYHPSWVKKNQERKFDQMVAFGERLPNLRQAVKGHMRQKELTRDRVIATIIWLLENTFIRVGNKTYAQENGSYGLTTMREKHIDFGKNGVKFSFKGKSGVFHELNVSQPTVVKTIRECIDLPGYQLFQYLDDDGNKRTVDSVDVNSYLQTHTGADFSAKDFRTWGGSVLAGDSFYKKGSAMGEQEIKDNISEVVTEVSNHLGNTKKVCRTYYIHPTIITAYEKDVLVPHFKKSYSHKSSLNLSLTPEEYATWSLIKDF